MTKQSGYPNGIYNFFIEQQKLKSLQKEDLIIKTRESLKKAIDEWQKELVKKKKKSFFKRFIEWMYKLLGIFSNEEESISSHLNTTKQKEEQSQSKDFLTHKDHQEKISDEKTIKKRTRPYVSKEKLKVIPKKIERGLSYVERNFGGFWIDELAKVLNYNLNEIEKLSSILYYDKYQRFEEIKALNKIKPLFIQRENLYNYNWLKEKIEYLEKSSKLPHQVALLEYLKSQLSLFD